MREVVSSLTARDIKTCRGVLTTENRDSTGTTRVGFTARLSDGRNADFMTKKKRLTDEKITLDRGDEAEAPEVRVGSYVVKLNVIDELVVPFLKAIDDDFHSDGNLMYIDEIGRAQSYSSEFLQSVERILKHTSQCVLASVVMAENTWSRVFKEQESVWLIEVTLDNRDHLPKILDAMYTHSSLFNTLCDTNQGYLKAMFFDILDMKMFVTAKKLFSNTVKYVVNGNVKRVASRESCSDRFDGSNGAGSTGDCDGEMYEVQGDMDNHLVHRARRCETSEPRKGLPSREGSDFSSVTNIIEEVDGVDCSHIHGGGDKATGKDQSVPILPSTCSSGRVLRHMDLFSCDCPLFLGEGPFAERPQLCSHILAVCLYRNQASQHPL